MKGSAQKQQEVAKKIDYVVEVSRAHAISDTVVMFDLVANGVTIYGMVYREYKTKEGKDGTMISFPSKKADNGKYYSHAWFPISNEVKEVIVSQLEKMI